MYLVKKAHKEGRHNPADIVVLEHTEYDHFPTFDGLWFWYLLITNAGNNTCIKHYPCNFRVNFHGN